MHPKLKGPQLNWREKPNPEGRSGQEHKVLILFTLSLELRRHSLSQSDPASPLLPTLHPPYSHGHCLPVSVGALSRTCSWGRRAENTWFLFSGLSTQPIWRKLWDDVMKTRPPNSEVRKLR